MALVPYAEPTDLAAWTNEDAPANAVPLLRSATILVARACQLDPYAALPIGETGDALRDATCAQAAYWAANGVDPMQGGYVETARLVQSAKVLSGEYRTDASTQAKQAAAAVDGLCAESRALLDAVNLIWTAVPAFDESSGALASWGLPARPRSSGWGWTSELSGSALARVPIAEELL